METSGAAERSPNIPPDNDPCPTKIAHQTWKWKGGWVGTSNFRRLKSCWINSSQVDPVQLVPTHSSPSFPPRKSYYFFCSLVRGARVQTRWWTTAPMDGLLPWIRLVEATFSYKTTLAVFGGTRISFEHSSLLRSLHLTASWGEDRIPLKDLFQQRRKGGYLPTSAPCWHSFRIPLFRAFLDKMWTRHLPHWSLKRQNCTRYFLLVKWNHQHL